ncbi:hypothetical protein ABW19_dt0202788 [Dactylella cylindrospora]|nr:hypothetical protein ABW19_dt0202788 [Dactylella cylindrospora]
MSGNDGVRGLYPTLPTFELNTFSSKEFIVKDFIEGLSQSVQSTRRSQGPAATAFDPKPYIRTFEAAVSRIKEINQDLAEQESELKEAVRRAELDHTRKVNELGKKLENTLDKFQKLDVNIGGKAVQIGSQLEQLDKQRMRAVDAKFLIECYVEFSRGDTSRLEKMRKSGLINDSIRCAVISRQLMSIAEKLDLSSMDRTRRLIEKFSESLEKDLLSQFDAAYRQMDITAMKGCAKVLHDFNGGASVKALFVNQHEFFITKQHLVTNEVVLGGDIWEQLPDPDAEPPPLEKSLAEIIEAARFVVIQESSLIKDIFPVPGDVTKSFLQRIFQQTIQQRLELVLEKAETISPLAFLRSLQAAKSSLDSLVEKLKENSEELNDKDTNNEIAGCLDQNLDDLFTPYLEGSVKYIEREKKSLQDLYESILFKFNTFHSRRKKVQNTTMFDRLRTQLQNSTTSATERVIAQLQDTDSANSRRTEQLLRLAGLGSFRERRHQNNAEKLAEIELEETDGQLSVDISKRMIKWLAESIGRSLELSSSADTPKDSAAFLSVLIDNVGLYVETALEGCLDFAHTAEAAKGEPDLSYFSELKAVNIILTLMHKTIHTALIPLAQSSLTIRREMSMVSTRFFGKVEERINLIIQKTVDVVLNHVTSILGKQPKRDFRPRDDDVHLDTLKTPTYHSISTFLENTHDLAHASLTGQNLTTFLYEIAVGFRTRFLENIQKNTINAAGGLMLIKDIVLYQSLFQKWDTDANHTGASGTVKESYELLHEVGNLYVVPANALKDRLQDGLLAKAKKDLLTPYLARREDYIVAGINRVVSMEIA